MAKHVITPAFSPDVVCEFEIPRENGKPIEFAVHRFDYIKDFDEKAIAWATERMKPIPELDENGAPVLDEEGNPKTREADPIEDREVILAHLKLAGVPQKTIAQLDKLTNGELSQIYEIWNKASRVSVGESQASDD